MASRLHAWSAGSDRQTSALADLSACCCCLPLRAGVVLIAVCGIIVGLMNLTEASLLDHQSSSVWMMIFNVLIILLVLTDTLLIVLSVYLLVAVIRKRPSWVALYVRRGVLYLSLKLSLTVAVGCCICFTDKAHFSTLISALTMMLVLGWLHFIAVAASYRKQLIMGALPPKQSILMRNKLDNNELRKTRTSSLMITTC